MQCNVRDETNGSGRSRTSGSPSRRKLTASKPPIQTANRFSARSPTIHWLDLTQPRGARASGFLSSHLSSRALHFLLRVVGSMSVCCMLRHGS
jgi:hypothetical protein